MSTTSSMKKGISNEDVFAILDDSLPKKRHFHVIDSKLRKVTNDFKGKWVEEVEQTGGNFYQNEHIQVTVVKMKSGKTAYKIAPQKYPNNNNVKSGKEHSLLLSFTDLNEEHFNKVTEILTKVIDEKRFDYFLTERDGLDVKNDIVAVFASKGSLFLLSA